MKTIKTLAEATRLAAESGAKLDVGGRLVNADGARVSVSRPSPPPAAQPAPEPPRPELPPSLTAAQVRQMLEERDAMWQDRVDSLQRQLDMLAAIQSAPRQVSPFRLKLEFDDRGAITEVVGTPLQQTLN